MGVGDGSVGLRERVTNWYTTVMTSELWTKLGAKHKREFDNFGEAWYSQLARIVLDGQPSSPRDLATLELCGEVFRVNNLRACLVQHPARSVNHRFSIAEFLWILSGSDNLEEIARYNQNLRQFSDDGEHLAGAYGKRLIGQWNYILETLKKPDTRQAVASIWTPNPQPSKDVACTTMVQWLIRDDKLNVIVSMRSSDVVLGLVYDFPVFAQLTNWLACRLRLETGWLQYQLGSAHIYSDKLDMCLEVLGHPESLSTRIVPEIETEFLPSAAGAMINPEMWDAQPWPDDLKFFVEVLRSKNRNQTAEVLDLWCRKVA